ncbi:MAG: CopD family protein [Piscinibacter sp.]|nr:CopD family protein [Piscinibacter sp.]
MTLHAALLTLHLLAAAYWVGGMAVVQTALRPAVAEALAEPPQRLALMRAFLRRFFAGVVVALALLWASGLAMVAAGGGWAAQPPRVHAMAALALLMTLVFGWIRARLYPRLVRAVGTDPAAAGAALAGIRRLVTLNLALGVAVFGVALIGRGF